MKSVATADGVLFIRIWQNPEEISLDNYDRLNGNKPLSLRDLKRCRDFLNAYIQDAQEREKTDDL